MELNIKSDVQAMEINVFSIAKIRIYFETSKLYRDFLTIYILHFINPIYHTIRKHIHTIEQMFFLISKEINIFQYQGIAFLSVCGVLVSKTIKTYRFVMGYSVTKALYLHQFIIDGSSEICDANSDLRDGKVFW